MSSPEQNVLLIYTQYANFKSHENGQSETSAYIYNSEFSIGGDHSWEMGSSWGQDDDRDRQQETGWIAAKWIKHSPITKQREES